MYDPGIRCHIQIKDIQIKVLRRAKSWGTFVHRDAKAVEWHLGEWRPASSVRHEGDNVELIGDRGIDEVRPPDITVWKVSLFFADLLGIVGGGGGDGWSASGQFSGRNIFQSLVKSVFQLLYILSAYRQWAIIVAHTDPGHQTAPFLILERSGSTQPLLASEEEDAFPFSLLRNLLAGRCNSVRSSGRSLGLLVVVDAGESEGGISLEVAAWLWARRTGGT